MCEKAVYPGTFDPLTYGHLDIIKRAKRIFPNLFIAVAANPFKKPLFSLKERIKLLKQATADMEDLVIESFDGLFVDYCQKRNIKVVIRGLRMISDFEYELQMAYTNHKIDKDIETVFFMPHESYAYISSKLIKEIACLGGDLSNFLPDFIEKTLKDKLKNRCELK